MVLYSSASDDFTILLQTFASVIADYWKCTTLATNHWMTMRSMIAKDPNLVIGKTTVDHMTALHVANSGGTAELLIRHGADVDALAKYCWTPLHVHSMNTKEPRSYEVMKVLLKHGANPNRRDVQGDTALVFALHLGDERKVTLLKANGALDLPY